MNSNQGISKPGHMQRGRPVVEWAVPNRISALPATALHIGGLLGARMETNVEHRLLAVDEDKLLHRFHERTSASDFANAWAGEHAGKFLTAACRSLESADNPALAAKVSRVAEALLAAQDDDGYLGTYVDGDHWLGWDIWVHKYVLVGLLHHYRVSGDVRVLAACRRIGELIVSTFSGPDRQRDINQAGWFYGMAATSILEPLCELYRMTGARAFLSFADEITQSWEHDNGAHILSALGSRGIDGLPNGKAYEFLSNLNGLTDLYRLTGRQTLLDAVLRAWEDLRATQAYATGSLSAMEYLQHGDRRLALPSSNLAETCVTVTWLQLTTRLFHLLGEARFGAECERTIFNHLLAAQDGLNGDICYYTALCGTKEYSHAQLCCVSSGPRALAALPDQVWAESEGQITLNLIAESAFSWETSGTSVRFRLESDFPASLGAELIVEPQAPADFTVRLRVPDWATGCTISIDGQQFTGAAGTWLNIRRTWAEKTRLTIDMQCKPEILPLAPTYPNRALLRLGPQLLTADTAANPDLARIDDIPLSPETAARLCALPDTGGDGQYFTLPAGGHNGGADQTIRLVPFSQARRHNMLFRTGGDRPAAAPPTLWARVFASHAHIPAGILGTTDIGSDFVGEYVTDNRTDTTATIDTSGLDVGPFLGLHPPDGSAWFILAFDRPLRLHRFFFRHGTNDAGQWFKTTPQLAIAIDPVMVPTLNPEARTHWRDIGALPDYPVATSGTGPDETYWLKLAEPVLCHGLRITGAPRSTRLTCGAFGAF